MRTASAPSLIGDFFAGYQSLRRRVAGALEVANATNTRLDQLKRALDGAPAAPRAHDSVRAIQKRLGAVLIALRGDTAIAQKSEGTPDSISERVNGIGFETSRTLAPPTGTHRQHMEIARALNSRSSPPWSRRTSRRLSARPRKPARPGRRAASPRHADRGRHYPLRGGGGPSYLKPWPKRMNGCSMNR